MSYIPQLKRNPDFSQFQLVLEKKRPDRPVLYEFGLNEDIHNVLTKDIDLPDDEEIRYAVTRIFAYKNAGYDFSMFGFPYLRFKAGEVDHQKSRSINEGGVIKNRADFEAYHWPDVSSCDFGYIDRIAAYLPEGMKLVSSTPGGVEENVIKLVGYETLCYMMADDPDLCDDIFAKVGSSLVALVEHFAAHPAVGACVSNDDWGFKTQTLLSREQMERYLFPWHKKIAAAVHRAGKKVILHSCGNIYPHMDVITNELQYDGKHSYEDEILPVEEAYDRYADRIAVLGGIDVDFICRSSPEEVYRRSREMLERSSDKGSYALGSGNSIPTYVPMEHYFAMIRAAHEIR
jgi:uroporphyrinogen decarboxylase